MTATVSDFIGAAGFSLRDAVALSDASLNLTNPKQDVVPSPPVLPQGIRFSVADGTNTDYYRVGVNVTGSIVAGGMDWVGVDIHPAAVRAYASGLSVTFHAFVSPKGFAPTVTVKAHESTSINLLDYFEMVGGKDADLSFIARPGGAEAQLAVSGSSLTVAGRTPGTMTASISAHDRAQGVATRTFSFVVLPANRPPQSDRAIGNPSVGVGATRVYDLSLYFSDPDVDALTYTVTGATSQTAAAAAVSGTELTIGGHSTGATTLVITASDGTLDISQQVHVTVPPNRRPVRNAHVEPVALNLGGPTVTRDIADAFTDPDGGTLSWLVQYEEGDPALQFMQEFWHVVSKQGSNLLNLESLFAYPGTTPPWSATLRPWVIPAGTDFVFKNGSPSVLTRGTLLSTATVRWDSGAGRVKVAIRTTDALPAAAISPPSRLLLGPDADVAWVEGDQTDTGLVNFLPGASPGSRTGYIEVWDAGSLFASDLFNIALGQRPTAKPVPAQTLFTGAGVTIPLNDHFTDPDGDALTYTVTVSRPHYVTTALIPRQTSGLPGATYAPGSIWFAVDLRIHAQTVGDVVVTVVATDAIGLTETLDIAVTIEASDVLGRTALIGRTRVHELIIRRGQDVVLVGGSTSTRYNVVANVGQSTQRLGVADSGISFAVEGPTTLILSDVVFETLAAADRALLSIDNLNDPLTSSASGSIEVAGERYLFVSVEQRQDGSQLLSHTFTLENIRAVGAAVRETGYLGGLLAIVAADSAVQALVGSRIYPLVLPQGSQLPALTYSVRTRFSPTLGGQGLALQTVTLTAWAASGDVAARVIAAVRSAGTDYILQDGTQDRAGDLRSETLIFLQQAPATGNGQRWATPARFVGGSYSSGPSWYRVSGGATLFEPPDGTPVGPYTFVFSIRDQRGAVSSQNVVVTVTAVAPVTPSWTLRTISQSQPFTWLSVGIDSTSDTDTDWLLPASWNVSVSGGDRDHLVHSIRITISGTAHTARVGRIYNAGGTPRVEQISR